MGIKTYFYRLIGSYVSLYARPEDNLVEVNPQSDDLFKHLTSKQKTQISLAVNESESTETAVLGGADYVVLNSTLHYNNDIQGFLTHLHRLCKADVKVVVIYYSRLWQPIIRLMTALGWREKTREQNWLSHSDIKNFATLSGFRFIQKNSRILIPIYIPLISGLVNGWIAPLAFFNQLTLVNIAVLATNKPKFSGRSSVSVVVPARNEEGNIDKTLETFPKMRKNHVLIFVEGNSTDNTWK